jgi:Holliday junction DNA helicase RuvA
MISAITGLLTSVEEDRALLSVGPVVVELLIPAADVDQLRSAVGDQVIFHTIFYLEGDSSGGNIDPKLVGFLRLEDRAFFNLFITVKGIGPKKALRALVLPTGDIAQAIETKDTRFLCQLPQIGKRMAELIVAELSGKASKFAVPSAPGKSGAPTASRHGAAEEDAIATLVALGERRYDAELLLDRAKHSNPDLRTAPDLVKEMLRLRPTRG